MADDRSGGVPTSSAISISCGRDADGKFPSSVLEDDSALTMLSNMDECWFWVNIVSRGLSNTLPAISSRSAVPAIGSSGPSLSTARGVEMVSPTVDATPDRNKTTGDGDGAELASCSFYAKPVQEKRHRRFLSDMPLDSRARIAADLTYDPHCWDSSGLASEKNGSRPTEQCKNTVGADKVVIAETPATPSAIKEVQHSGITRPPKLVSIPSGKLLADDEPAPAIIDTGVQQAKLPRRERRRTSKSMTDLEFDELKGFMELGFRFDKDELSPQIVNVLPALQRLAGQGKIHTPAVSRPYLSEAWLIRRSDSPLLNWRMPPLKGQGVDMKQHLKFWARAVASTVQQES